MSTHMRLRAVITTLGSTLALSALVACGGAAASSNAGSPASSPSGSAPSTTESSTTAAAWPDGKMHVDDWHTTTSGDEVVTYIVFTDPTGKHHRFDITYGFMSAEVAKVTFDGQALTQLPQYRALSKYLADHGLDMDRRALDVLACTRPDDDHVNTSNPTCTGWHNS